MEDETLSKSVAKRLNAQEGNPPDSHYEPNKIIGDVAKRSWCVENAELISSLHRFPNLRHDGTRFWEYPYVFNIIKKQEKYLQDSLKIKEPLNVLDIGAGEGFFSYILKLQGFNVTATDNYSGCWEKLEEYMKETGVDCVDGDSRDLSKFEDSSFDVSLLVSVIEHIPSNTIYCEKRGCVKTAEMLEAENSEKKKAINEAIRVTKKGGIIVITSDIYLDYPDDMNISWEKLLGLKDLTRNYVLSLGDEVVSDLYISDNPIHKGRILPVCITIEKR